MLARRCSSSSCSSSSWSLSASSRSSSRSSACATCDVRNGSCAHRTGQPLGYRRLLVLAVPAGNRRYWRNVLRGLWSGLAGRRTATTPMSCRTARTRARSRSPNVIASPACSDAAGDVSPRGVLGALAENSIGAPGISFELIDFNDRFDVQSSDEAFAVELIDAQMIETLLESRSTRCMPCSGRST